MLLWIYNEKGVFYEQIFYFISHQTSPLKLGFLEGREREGFGEKKG